MLRPGRLETLCFVGLPGPEERVEILSALLSKTPILKELAQCAAVPSCDGYTGADLSSLVRQAGQAAIKRGADCVSAEDFVKAMAQVRRSVSNADMKRYEKMRVEFQSKI
jgi:ribosome biogenesis ATPase